LLVCNSIPSAAGGEAGQGNDDQPEIGDHAAQRANAALAQYPDGGDHQAGHAADRPTEKDGEIAGGAGQKRKQIGHSAIPEFAIGTIAPAMAGAFLSVRRSLQGSSGVAAARGESSPRPRSLPMSIQAILLPLFVEVLLTFVVGFWLAGLRVSGVRRGEVNPRDIALGEPNWPKRTLQVRNSYHNQFELPLLFYLLTMLSIMTRHADFLFVVLAWVFVLSRLAHAYVHVTDNHLGRRGALFGIGAVVLAIMWVIFIVRILLALP
jgi:hypothetical protein